MSGPQAQRELEVYKRIQEIGDRDRGGWLLIQKLEDDFKIDGPQAEHICLVLQLLGSNQYDEAITRPFNVLNKNQVRSAIWRVILALNYLHIEAHLIHTSRCFILLSRYSFNLRNTN